LNRLQSMIQHSLCAAEASFFTQIIVYPLDVIRTRLTVEIGPTKARIYRYMGQVVIHDLSYGAIGVNFLYSGLLFSLLTGICYRSILFGFYQYLIYPKSKSNFYQNYLWAQTATFLSQLYTYPLEVIRRRLMVRPDEFTKVEKRDVIQDFISGGVKGAYRGFLASIIGSITTSLSLAFYTTWKYKM